LAKSVFFNFNQHFGQNSNARAPVMEMGFGHFLNIPEDGKAQNNQGLLLLWEKV